MGENGKSDLWGDFAQRFAQVKFAKGLVGKTTHAMLLLIAAWGVIFWRLSPDLVQSSCLIGGGIVITLAVMWWVTKTQNFVEKNPQYALLDGAEFLQFHRTEAEIKGLLKPSNTSLVPAYDMRTVSPDEANHPDRV